MSTLDRVMARVDSREHLSQLAEILNNRGFLKVTVGVLPVGDAIVSGICIERKTVRDFQTSIIDGRLFRQLSKMRYSFKRCLLIIEENSESFVDSLHTQAAHGALLKITAGWQVPYILSNNTLETAEIIEKIAMQEVNAYGGILPKRHGFKPKKKSSQMRYVLEGVPGIGSKRSHMLLESFKDLYTTFNASIEMIAKVPGISQKTALSFHEFINMNYD